jgi:uncharacterized protein YjbI with pentapeptide repeats
MQLGLRLSKQVMHTYGMRFRLNRWIRDTAVTFHSRAAHLILWILLVVAMAAGTAFYVFALWRAPSWAHAVTETARYDSRVLVISIGGALVVGIGLLYTARNYRLSHRGQVTDRFTQALEKLGSEAMYVRIGGIYALEHVMRDSSDHHRDVVEVLVAFIRDRAPEPQDVTDAWDSPPTADVQAALTALARRPRRPEAFFLNLRGIVLVRANLPDGNLRDADFTNANLSKAWLSNSDLRGSWLMGAHLNEAWLSGADMSEAQLTGANLDRARLDYSNLYHTGFRNAKLVNAQMCNASYKHANFANANLTYMMLGPDAKDAPPG